MRSLVWFRRDLRTIDNPALHHATQIATQGSKGGTVALFVMTPQQWLSHDDAPVKISFWLRNLKTLSESLAKLNIPLIVKTCNTFDEVPAVVKLANRLAVVVTHNNSSMLVRVQDLGKSLVFVLYIGLTKQVRLT